MKVHDMFEPSPASDLTTAAMIGRLQADNAGPLANWIARGFEAYSIIHHPPLLVRTGSTQGARITRRATLEMLNLPMSSSITDPRFDLPSDDDEIIFRNHELTVYSPERGRLNSVLLETLIGHLQVGESAGLMTAAFWAGWGDYAQRTRGEVASATKVISETGRHASENRSRGLEQTLLGHQYFLVKGDLKGILEFDDPLRATTPIVDQSERSDRGPVTPTLLWSNSASWCITSPLDSTFSILSSNSSAQRLMFADPRLEVSAVE
jgi:hypothetical protein